MKKCSRCTQEKQEVEFTVDRRKKEGIGVECKECYNKNKQEWRNANRDHVNKLSRKYCKKRRKEKREECKELSRKFRERHKDRLNEKRKAFWKKNAVRLRERQNELAKRPEQRKKIAAYMREYRKTKYSDQNKAHKVLEYAVKVGFIKRPIQCEKCMIECNPDGHHEDYSKPLEVIWLCHVCHHQAHGKLLDIDPKTENQNGVP